MQDHYLYVEINSTSNSCEYPTTEEIQEIFGVYGNLHEIISDETLKHFFCVVYERRRFALRCLNNRKSLYRKHGFIIERSTSLQDEDELRAWSEGAGRTNPDLPSLLDLNDDCLLQIIRLAPDSLKNVCVRLRRLCLTRYNRTLLVDENFHDFDRLFHIGDKVKHLTVTKFGRGKFSYKIFQLMLMRCTNLESLVVMQRRLGGRMPNFKYISTQLKELYLDGYHFSEDLGSVVESLSKRVKKLEKIRITYLMVENHTLFLSLALKLATLNTVILGGAVFSIGLLLSKMPQLRVLSCRLTQGNDSSSYPDNHGLIEWEISLDDEDMEWDEIVKIRKICKNLRHLRISHDIRYGKFDSNLLLSTAKRLYPLEGLHLSKVTLTPDFLYLFADSLKILLLDDCNLPDDFDLMVARFKKLEVLSWDESYRKPIDVFLENRPPSALKIVCGNSHDLSLQYSDPLITWAKNPQKIFGPFSIYSRAR